MLKTISIGNQWCFKQKSVQNKASGLSLEIYYKHDLI